jgi:hypothetical protein
VVGEPAGLVDVVQDGDDRAAVPLVQVGKQAEDLKLVRLIQEGGRYCGHCDASVHRIEFTSEIPQRGYWQAVAEYNSDARLRTCSECGQVQDQAELGDIAWDVVADVLGAAVT